ncbi:MAG: homoserine dehydrogenase [Thermaerobacter sp.]|nr:homoserine dehydrogenase [Thermaerobacter sp.]
MKPAMAGRVGNGTARGDKRTHRLALIGFGVVSQGLVEILLKTEERLSALGTSLQVVAISDPQKGSLYHPAGLDLAEIVRTIDQAGNLAGYPETPGLARGWDSLTTIARSNADTVIEATYTNIATGQPGLDHCRAALAAGKNVVTTNKGPVALAYDELLALAAEKGVRFAFEGTVMSGTPTLRLLATSLAGNQILGIRGILNGTTNYILTRMEDGFGYAEALSEAQRLGYAEADPGNDVEGYDALYKLLILGHVLFNRSIAPASVARRGISQLAPADIARAKEEGKRWKLIAKITRDGEDLSASVVPEMLPLADPLAGVGGATNAMTYDCDLSGAITVVGAGAGRIETGYALLIDCVNVVRGER